MSLLSVALAEKDDMPLKDRWVYTNISQAMAFYHFKAKGYESLSKMPYDLYCPSIQKKVATTGGECYQCASSECRKMFTTLALSAQHHKKSGYKKIVPTNLPDIESDKSDGKESCEDLDPAPMITIWDLDLAPMITIREFTKSLRNKC